MGEFSFEGSSDKRNCSNDKQPKTGMKNAPASLITKPSVNKQSRRRLKGIFLESGIEEKLRNAGKSNEKTLDRTVEKTTDTERTIKTIEDPPPGESLFNLMRVCEVAIKLQFEQDETLNIDLTSNLIVKKIRSQCALSELIIGDQLLAINGKIVSNVDQAQRMLASYCSQLYLIVGRTAYKEPISAERASKIRLKRKPGYSYFVVTMKRFSNIHLGLTLKALKDKITITKTSENSLASFVYLAGDVILDVNGEEMTTIAQLKDRMMSHMKRDSAFTSVIERFEPTQSMHNVKFYEDQATVDPDIANDVAQICKREINKIKCWKKLRQTTSKNVVTGKPIIRRKQSEDLSTLGTIEEKASSQNSVFAKLTSNLQPRRSNSRFETIESSSSRSSRKKRQKKQHILINTSKNEEEKITSDVQNAGLLQHVGSLSKQGLLSKTLTFMPKMFNRNS